MTDKELKAEADRTATDLANDGVESAFAAENGMYFIFHRVRDRHTVVAFGDDLDSVNLAATKNLMRFLKIIDRERRRGAT